MKFCEEKDEISWIKLTWKDTILQQKRQNVVNEVNVKNIDMNSVDVNKDYS